MQGRVQLTVVGFGMALLLALTIWLVAGAPGGPATSASTPVQGFAGALRPANLPSSPLTGLRDERGQPIDLASGDVTIVTFLYTTCEDTCPATAQQIRGALDRLDDPPPVVAISVDPEQDDEANARTFLAKQRLTGRMTYALGPRAALERQWKTYAIQPQLDDAEHTASVVLLDRQGRQRIGFPANHLTPEAVADDVQRLRAEPAA